MGAAGNTAIVKAFYHQAFNTCRPADAVQSFAADRYVEHSPTFDGGKEVFIEYFVRLAREHPGKRVEFRRAIAEGDFVVLHCRYQWLNDRDCDGIDIFRLDASGRIAQHWGFIERVPERSPHAIAMA